MKRMHVHVVVDNLDQSIRFYSALFAAKPAVLKPDYAKWMLEDPKVNFAISIHDGRTAGIDHLGIQVEDDAELLAVYGRLKEAEGPVFEEGKTTCCYARSEKSWTVDPQGVRWEAFLTTGESTVYGTSVDLPSHMAKTPGAGAACCGPSIDAAPKTADKTSACCT